MAASVDLLKEYERLPYLGQEVTRIQKQIVQDFNDKLKQLVTRRLKEIGFEFALESEFIEFCKERVTRILYHDYYEIMLDYNHDKKEGVLIASYSEKVNISQTGSTMIITIG